MVILTCTFVFFVFFYRLSERRGRPRPRHDDLPHVLRALPLLTPGQSIYFIGSDKPITMLTIFILIFVFFIYLKRNQEK